MTGVCKTICVYPRISTPGPNTEAISPWGYGAPSGVGQVTFFSTPFGIGMMEDLGAFERSTFVRINQTFLYIC